MGLCQTDVTLWIFSLLLCTSFSRSTNNNVLRFSHEPASPSRIAVGTPGGIGVHNHSPSAHSYHLNIGQKRHVVLTAYNSSNHSTKERFLSFCISASIFWKKDRWQEFHTRSEKLQNLAAALSPSDIRIGGTNADFLTFDPDAKSYADDRWGKKSLDRSYEFDSGYFDLSFGEDIKNFTMTGKEWDTMTVFFDKVGWDLMFDFNLFKWRDGLWDPSNAELLLNYSANRGIKIPAFQLGNEPNSFHHNFNLTVSPSTLLKDFQILKNLISKYPQYKNAGLYGPDVTNLDRHAASREYLQGFIAAGAESVVDEISLHHYYLNGRIATADDFLDVSTLDSLKGELELALNATKHSSRQLPIRLTETSSCYGGGAPGLSDGYVAGFLWLDKLGLAAQYGVTRVFRQTFFGGSYALVSDTLDPNPDFFLSVMYKRLIEGPVFNVSLEPPIPHVRVYAHCARSDQYDAGALVIYFLNLRAKEAILSLTQFQDDDLDLYLFTPGDDQGLKSRFVKLNGETLLMSGSKLPPMLPKPHKGDVTVEPQSFGFIVVPGAKIPLCIKYFNGSVSGGS